jgi:uncharacterized oligopeptide transporter (OPT) family protein
VKKGRQWVPSPTGIGIGMLVPAAAVAMMFVGSAAEYIWRKVNPRTNDQFMTPLASGLIAGEAIVAVIVPLLVLLKIVHT